MQTSFIALITRMALAAVFLTVCASEASAQPANPNGGAVDPGRTSITTMSDQYIFQYPEASWMRSGDVRDANNNPIPGFVNPATVPGASPFGTMFPPTPAAAMGFATDSRLTESMYVAGLRGIGGFTGQAPSDLQNYASQMQAGDFLARMVQYPANVANLAKAQALGTAQAMSNAMGDITKSQSASAISYCSNFMQNFTVDESNRWNKIRNGLFVPIAMLLLLPGAILTQVKTTIAAGNPVLDATGQVDLNPFEGILRSVVAVFMVPATYLIVNYGIDFSNSITYSIASTYQSLMNSNMYQEALSSEVRAFPVRNPKENQNAGTPANWPAAQINNVSDFDKYISNKVQDPSAGLNEVPADRTDEAMPAGVVAARELSFGANAALTAGWNILCAFQMAYLAYLFFVGPIVAALWVWPIEQFRQAFPAWVEGVLTLCFWSMFWNTAILLMACFKGVDQNGTLIMSALNFLALSSVKYAFDFAGLVKEAGQEAAKRATDKNAGQNGGGKQGASGARGRQDSRAQNGGAASPAVANDSAPAAAPANASANLAGTSAPSLSTPLMPAANLTATDPGVTGNELANGLANVALPPLAFTAPSAKDIQSQSVQLGNYSLSQGLDDQGQNVGLLKDANGNVIAHLPADLQNGQSIQTTDGSDLTYNSTATGDSYSLVDNAGQTFNAVMSPLSDSNAEAPGSVAGVIDPTGARNNDSIALRSSQGTLLLENNGNTVLMPRADGKGYDAFNISQSNPQANFALGDSSSLAISIDSNGARHIGILDANRGREDFVVAPNSNGGYDIQRSVNGGEAASTQVRTDGQSTHYYHYAPNGNVSEVDSVSALNIASSYFDYNNGALLGNAITDYSENGSSSTSYYDANGTLTASSSHHYKEGGSYDVVRDGNGNIISSEELTQTPDGGYTVQVAKYEGNSVASSQTSVYDSSSRLVNQTPVELHRNAVDAVAASAVANAEKNYQIVSSLLNNGKGHQATQVLNSVSQDFRNMQNSPNAKKLLD